MKKNDQCVCYPVGVWESVEFHTKTPKGWKFFAKCQPDEVARWEFGPDGKVFERSPIAAGYIVICNYEPLTQELHIARGYSESHPGSMDDRFRIESVSDTELFLYHLEGVEHESTVCSFRIKAKKITSL